MPSAKRLRRDLRVRDLGSEVRVEVAPGVLAAVSRLPDVSQAVAMAGFADSPVRIAAFSSGSLNSALPAELRFR